MKRTLYNILIAVVTVLLFSTLYLCKNEENDNESLLQVIGAWFLLNQTSTSGLTIKIPNGVPL
ncbi:MAG: hypothetical protein KDK39_06775 [Leptospiraceae bacterium]|nr:hypothetical protein [Leptospiraceae bacterium]